MHLSPLRVLSAAVIPLLVLTACGGDKADTSAAKPSPLDVITVGGTDKAPTTAGQSAPGSTAPTLTFKTKPLTVKETTTKVVTEGKGEKTSKENFVSFFFALYNGKDDKSLQDNFGKTRLAWNLSSANLVGLGKGLTGQRVGSRLLIAIPPVDAFGTKGNQEMGISATDTIVFLVDLVASTTPLKAVSGTAVPPQAGVPTATVDGAKPAKITIPQSAAPTKLVVQPMSKGAGPLVKAGQTIKANYTGVVWKTGKQFDATGDRGESADFPIGVGEVVPGWDKGLVGQAVGSRILLVVPPAEGYGATGKPPTIAPTDTLVFVVDILAAV